MPSQELIDWLNKASWREFDKFIKNNKDKFTPFFYYHWISAKPLNKILCYYKTCLKHQQCLNYRTRCYCNWIVDFLREKHNCHIVSEKIAYKSKSKETT